jgi:hypothetical protein
VLVWSAAAQKCETWDEGLFVAGGVLQVETLDANVELTHPPLLRWLAGVPAAIAGARVPSGARPSPLDVPRGAADLTRHRYGEIFGWAQRLLYDRGHDHERVLGLARAPFALLAALCAWLVFRGARRLGPWIAAVAAGVFLLLPEVLAHAQWAHSDVAATLATLLVALALARAVERGTAGAAAALGLALGFAAGVKHTGLLLVPVALIAVLVLLPPRAAIRGALVATAVAWLALIAAYLPEPRIVGPHAFLPADLAAAGLGPLRPVLRWAPLPDTMLKGVVHTMIMSARGQPAFFAGEIGPAGWTYFPAAIAMKYPTGLLLLAAAGLVCLWRTDACSRARKLALTAPPLVVLAAAMSQSIQIGVRSVLPLAPFFALWSAEALARAGRRSRAVAGVLLGLSMAQGAAAYPDFLAHFHPLLGGTEAAGRFLADSNLDWGQDLPALAGEIRARRIEGLRLGYFGTGLPSHYGIRAGDAREPAAGWFAVSRTALAGVHPRGDPYAWLRALRPVTYVGGSIALFFVRDADLAAALRRRPPAAGAPGSQSPPPSSGPSLPGPSSSGPSSPPSPGPSSSGPSSPPSPVPPSPEPSASSPASTPPSR